MSLARDASSVKNQSTRKYHDKSVTPRKQQ